MRHLWRTAVLVLVLSGAVCCATASPLRVSRTPREQWGAGVQVTVTCDGAPQWGSGVLVSASRVITALHVVTCPGGLEPKIEVDAGDGPVNAKLEIAMPQSDLARLYVSANLEKWFTPVSIGPDPGTGDRACWVAETPRTTYRCGTVEDVTVDQIWLDGFVEHGNSGAGLYNGRGQLVGIVTATLVCQTGVFCAGWARSLSGLEWLVP